MLELVVGSVEMYDETTESFFTTPGRKVRLEHSLLSVSKWEERWLTPFLAPREKSSEQLLYYFECMLFDPSDAPELEKMGPAQRQEIADYLKYPASATTVREIRKSAPSREEITSELIYYWMTAMSIPFSCETWNINRLLMLIRVANVKSQPAKKGRLSKSDLAERKALNDQRRALMGGRG